MKHVLQLPDLTGPQNAQQFLSQQNRTHTWIPHAPTDDQERGVVADTTDSAVGDATDDILARYQLT